MRFPCVSNVIQNVLIIPKDNVGDGDNYNSFTFNSHLFTLTFISTSFCTTLLLEQQVGACLEFLPFFLFCFVFDCFTKIKFYHNFGNFFCHLIQSYGRARKDI